MTIIEFWPVPFIAAEIALPPFFPALKRKEKRETNFNKDLKQDRSSFDLVYQKLKIVHNARPKNPNNIPSKITHKMEKSKRSTNTYSKC